MPLTRWRTPLLAAVCAVAVATIYAAQPVLEQIGGDLGAPEASVGWIVAVGQLGYLVGLIFLVPLGEMLDRRRLIAGQLLLAAGGTLLAVIASTLWLLLVGIALTGLFAAIVQTTVAFASDLSTKADRGRTLGIVTSGVTLGILGVRVVSGALAAQWGWRSTYVALTLLLAILSAAVYRTLPA